MDEITFVDVLTHYRLKLKEVNDEIETLKNYMKKAEESIDCGWKGAAADACRCKLEAVGDELTKTQAELSEALIKLSAISEQVAQEEITTV